MTRVKVMTRYAGEIPEDTFDVMTHREWPCNDEIIKSEESRRIKWEERRLP